MIHQFDGPLDRLGNASLKVEIGVSGSQLRFLLEHGQAPPASVAALALIDTGSEEAIVGAEVVNQLGVCPKGTARVREAMSAPKDSGIYHLSLRFPEMKPELLIARITVLAGELEDPMYRLILGRSFLQQCDFRYRGYMKRLVLQVLPSRPEAGP